jgi:endo-beta-N-acetylglucosaminidase D
LGTFITEFGQGRLRCDRMFSSPESARQVADQLVAIAQHYGFEGWLVRDYYT